jgi:hypothetical protein
MPRAIVMRLANPSGIAAAGALHRFVPANAFRPASVIRSTATSIALPPALDASQEFERAPLR